MVRIKEFAIFNFTSHPLTFGHKEGENLVVDFEVPLDKVVNVEVQDVEENIGDYKVYRRLYKVPEETYKALYDAWAEAQDLGLTAIVYVSSTTIQALKAEGFKAPEGLIVGGVKIISPRGQRPPIAEAFGIIV